MIKNVFTNFTIADDVTSEYKIGNTTYKVVTKFNLGGENLNNVLARLIKKEINKAA